MPNMMDDGHDVELERELVTLRQQLEAVRFPVIAFPVAFDDIPKHVATLTKVVKDRQVEIDTATMLLEMVRRGCKHEGAERGHNERDGSWMNPCPHCGATE